MESAGRVTSPSRPKVRTFVKVPDCFKTSGLSLKIADQIKSPESPQAPLSPEAIVNSEREHNGMIDKSTVSGTTEVNIKLLSTSTNQMDTTDDQSLTPEKVVKVVRCVARKVLPTEKDEFTGPLYHFSCPGFLSLPAPSHFTPDPKSAVLETSSTEPPCLDPRPLSPPAGVSHIQQHTVCQLEVQYSVHTLHV